MPSAPFAGPWREAAMNDLRERLIQLEPLSEERNQKLQQEVKIMFEPKLSRWEKVYWGLSAAGSAFFAVCALAVMFAPAEPRVRALWGVLGVVNALAAGFILRGL